MISLVNRHAYSRKARDPRNGSDPMRLPSLRILRPLFLRPFFLLIGAVLAGAATVVHAEAVSFSGKVVDASGAPVAWAILKVEGSDLTGQSGLDGGFTLTGNAATVRFYADPRPAKPFAGPAAKTSAPVRYLLSGRAASDRRLASGFLLAASPAEDASLPLASAPRTGRASESDPPPPPPALAKTASVFNIIVTMAHYRTETFPQSAVSAKNLSLSLSPSATDTAAYAAEKKLCLDTINALRAEVGLKEVTWSKSLEAFADQGARYDGEKGTAHAHFSAFSKGAVPSDAENAVPGWPLKSNKTVAAVVAKGAKMMWDEGPGGGHYENIKGNHTQVGCGIYVTAAGNVWVIHDFK